MEIITNEIKTLGEMLQKHGHKVRVVGGAVRDFIVGIEPKDIDVCTTAHPENVISIMEEEGIRCIPTGIDHGTVTVIINNIPIEITTLRIDTNCDGRRATVKFTNNWKADAERRDLTMNAMSMDLKGKIFDYFGGKEDLASGTVRFVGNADRRIKEDHLRIMRFFRFAARFNCQNFDQEAIEAIKNNVESLRFIANERIWAELSKTIMTDTPVKALQMMNQLKVLKFAFSHPGDQGNQWKSTGIPFTTSDAKIERMAKLPKHLGARLAILMDHQMVARPFDKIMTIESSVSDFVHQMHHFGNPMNPEHRITLSDSRRMMARTKDVEKTRDVLVHLCLLHKLPRLSEEVRMMHVPNFPVKGQDFMVNGMKQGPAVGAAMTMAQEVWADSAFTMTKEEVMQEVLVRAMQNG